MGRQVPNTMGFSSYIWLLHMAFHQQSPSNRPMTFPKKSRLRIPCFLGGFPSHAVNSPSGFTEPPIIREVVPTILMKRLRGSTGCKTVKHVFSLFSTVFSIGETLLFSIVFNGVFNGLLVQLVHCFSISVFVFFRGFVSVFHVIQIDLVVYEHFLQKILQQLILATSNLGVRTV